MVALIKAPGQWLSEHIVRTSVHWAICLGQQQPAVHVA
jgi:hypothetical protein